MIRVLIADDQELIRESLKIVLSVHSDIQICGTCANGFEVLELMKRQPADIIKPATKSNLPCCQMSASEHGMISNLNLDTKK